MTVSLTLTFADLAQAHRALAAMVADAGIPAGSHVGPVCQHDQSGATASAIAGQGTVEGPEGGTTGIGSPAADPVTVASVAGLHPEQDGSEIGEVKGKARLPNAVGVEPLPSSTNQPEGANEAGRFESGSLTEIMVKPQVRVLPGDAFGVAKGGPTGMGRSDSVERHAPHTSPANPADDDGHPSIPTIDARAAGQGGDPHCMAQSVEAVPHSRERKPLRPHCQSPDDLEKCAGRGREHCHACTKAMAQSEAA